MSFGFSVGDFIAVGSLIVKCIDVLRNTQFEYQELVRELERYVQSSLIASAHQLSISSYLVIELTSYTVSNEL